MALTKEDLQAIQNALAPQFDELRTGLGEVRAETKETRAGLDDLRVEVKETRAGLDEVRTGLDEVRADIRRIDQSVTKLEALPRQVAAIAEGQTATHDRLDHMQTQVDSVEKKLENSMVIKAVTP